MSSTVQRCTLMPHSTRQPSAARMRTQAARGALHAGLSDAQTADMYRQAQHAVGAREPRERRQLEQPVQEADVAAVPPAPAPPAAAASPGARFQGYTGLGLHAQHCARSSRRASAW